MLGEFVETCEAKQVQIDQTTTQLQFFASCVCSFSFVNTLGITVFSNDPLFGVQSCILLLFCEFSFLSGVCINSLLVSGDDSVV
jgi:hypothetical protein